MPNNPQNTMQKQPVIHATTTIMLLARQNIMLEDLYHAFSKFLDKILIGLGRLLEEKSANSVP